MKKKLLLVSLALSALLPAMAENGDTNPNPKKGDTPTVSTAPANEFRSEETLEEGFLTQPLNDAIAAKMDELGLTYESAPAKDDKLHYGRNVSGYASAPKFGGYIIGKYSYTDRDNAASGDGFNIRLIRVYVDGTVLRDFKYRIQMELNGTAHLKDAQVEWAKYKQFSAKMGQFKRPFTFENPYNPWNVGLGDYSQLTKKLAGMGDYTGEASMGGRDQGLQVQGDLFPVAKDHHSLIQYQLGVFNGQGINKKDADSKKDVIGNVKFQPVKGWLIGLFGWHGTYTADNLTVDRNRWAVGSTYENGAWRARVEYAHSQGHKLADYKTDGTVAGTGRADAWYATVGVPCTDWLTTFVRYDAYRDQATWGSLKTLYSICPNFQLHKNLMFQVQYNYVVDKTAADNRSHELWLEAYIRF
jgi:hypothetical protein